MTHEKFGKQYGGSPAKVLLNNCLSNNVFLVFFFLGNVFKMSWENYPGLSREINVSIIRKWSNKRTIPSHILDEMSPHDS